MTQRNFLDDDQAALDRQSDLARRDDALGRVALAQMGLAARS